MKKTLLSLAVITVVATTISFAAVEFTAAHGFGSFMHRGDRTEVMAEALGISADELEAELKEGLSFNEIAESHGTTVQELHEAMQQFNETRLSELVASGKITQEQVDAHREHMIARMAEKAKWLGLSENELRALLDEGKIFPEIMEMQGVTIDQLHEARKREVLDHLGQELSDGTITQEQYDRRVEWLELSGGVRGVGRPHHRGFGSHLMGS